MSSQDDDDGGGGKISLIMILMVVMTVMALIIMTNDTGLLHCGGCWAQGDPTHQLHAGRQRQTKKNGKNSFTGKIDQLWEGRDKIWVQDVDFFLLPGLLHLRGGAGGNATKY